MSERSFERNKRARSGLPPIDQYSPRAPEKSVRKESVDVNAFQACFSLSPNFAIHHLLSQAIPLLAFCRTISSTENCMPMVPSASSCVPEDVFPPFQYGANRWLPA